MLLELIGLAIAIPAVATMARSRGASPALAGTAAAVGYVLLRFIGPAFLRGEDALLALIVAAWA